jgi:hypothetical protein
VREPGAQIPTVRPDHAARSVSIRVKIGLSFGLIAALAVALLAGVLSMYSVQREHQDAQSDQIVVARNLASLVDEHIEDTVAGLSLVAADPVLLDDLETGNHPALNYRLERLLRPEARLTALVVVDERGMLVAISARDKSQIGRVAGPASDARAAMRDQRPMVGPPQRGALTGAPLVPLTIPIIAADGRSIGALTGVLPLARLSDLIESARSDTSRYVRLFDA